MSTFNKFSVVTVLVLFMFGCGGGGGGSSVAPPPTDESRCGTIIDIGPNSILNGVLETGDCLLSSLDLASSATSFADEYLITLKSMATLTITMRSSDLDSYLHLLNRSTSCSNGCTPAEAQAIAINDNSGGGVNGTDAFISMELAPGTYLIGANSAIPQTGSYSLETSFRNPTGPYSIGQIGPAGGIVFFIANGGLTGLEAAPVDQSAGAPWGCHGTLLLVNGTAIGTGAQNTADIISGCADAGIAARLAANYSLNGFHDWFLPSKDELNELYLQRAVVGGFSTAGFWSSTEGFGVSAWSQDFSDGSVGNGDKNNSTGVRAIRAFN